MAAPDSTVLQWLIDQFWVPATTAIVAGWTALSGMQSHRIKKVEEKADEAKTTAAGALSREQYREHLDDHRVASRSGERAVEGMRSEINSLRGSMETKLSNLDMKIDALTRALYEGDRRRHQGDL